jgi:hypothetical protein
VDAQADALASKNGHEDSDEDCDVRNSGVNQHVHLSRLSSLHVVPAIALVDRHWNQDKARLVVQKRKRHQQACFGDARELMEVSLQMYGPSTPLN